MKTTREVIEVLKDEMGMWNSYYAKTVQGRHHVACLKRAIAIVRASDRKTVAPAVVALEGSPRG